MNADGLIKFLSFLGLLFLLVYYKLKQYKRMTVPSPIASLCEWILANDRLEVLSLLEKGINLNQTTAWDSIQEIPCSTVSPSIKEGQEDPVYEALPLHLAVIKGRLDIVSDLLNAGADPLAKDGRNRTALVCVLYGSLDTLVITPENFKKVTCCTESQTRILELLLAGTPTISKDQLIREANLPQEGPFLRGITPLCLASYLGKLPIVSGLLLNGVEVDSRDRNGATALMYAARDGHASVVEFLLSRNATFDLQDQNGWKAIQYGQSFPKIIQLLEDATIKAQGVWNLFPASLMDELSAQYPGFYLDLSSYLAKYNESGNAAESQKQESKVRPGKLDRANPVPLPKKRVKTQALFNAIVNNDVVMLKTLLDESPEAINAKESSIGSSLLLFTLRHRPLKFPEMFTLIQVLMAAGANAKDVDPETQKTCLHFLLEDPFMLQGADANKTRSLDRSVYSLKGKLDSSQEKSILFEMVKFLIDRGCEPDLADVNGNRPVHHACKLDDLSLVRFLVLNVKVSLIESNKLGLLPLDVCPSGGKAIHFVEPRTPSKFPTDGEEQEPREVKLDLNLEPLQRMQDLLIKAFEDASLMMSQELSKETIVQRVNENRALDKTLMTPSLSMDVLKDSEKKREALESELLECYQIFNSQLVEKDVKILELESQLQALTMANQVDCNELVTVKESLKTKEAELKQVESQNSIVKDALVKSSEFCQTLSCQVEELKSNHSQLVRSLQSRIKELEELVCRKDQVLHQFSDTQRVLGRYENKRMGFIQPSSPPKPSRSPQANKVAQLDLHLDILKANIDAINEDINASNAALEKTQSTSEVEEEDRIQDDLARLKSELCNLQQQLSQKLQERELLVGQLPRETTSNKWSPDRGFMHLEELLGQLQLNTVEVTPPYTPSDSPTLSAEKSSPNRHFRMSTIINQEDVDVDPILLNKLLDAAKRRIERLKSNCEALKEEAGLLQSRLDEKDLHIQETYGLLQSANRRAAEAESKFSRVGSEQEKHSQKLEKIDRERRQELAGLQRVLIQLLGQASNPDDFDNFNGLLGSLRALVLDLDPAVLSSLPAHLLNPGTDDLLQAPEVLQDTKLDIHRCNSHFVSTLSLATTRVKEYVDHIGQALSNMKDENKKFVKEIMKLKKAAVVQSLVSGVRDSVVEPLRTRGLPRLDLEADYRRPSPRRVIPSASPVSPLMLPASTPHRPFRAGRESVASTSNFSDTSSKLASVQVPAEANDLLSSLKRLKLEIAHVEAQENQSPETKARVEELRSEYRDFVKRLMTSLKRDSVSRTSDETTVISEELTSKSEQPLTKGQEIKQRLRQMSSSLSDIKGALTEASSPLVA